MLKALPRLLARLSPQSLAYKEFEEKLYRIQAGYAGERKIDRRLETIPFTKPVIILTDLQLPITPKLSIQIDTLILSQSYILILEIKNIAGTLTYVSNPPHFERTVVGKNAIVIDCPLMQLENNRTGLNLWLENNGFPPISTGLIVLANSNTAVRNAPPEMPIIYGKHLPYYFRTQSLGELHLTQSQLHKLARKLKQSEKVYNPYPLCEKHNIDIEQVRKGYICNDCHQLLYRKNHLTWMCNNCRRTFEKPYRDALQDWFMIVKNSISNEECRQFLNLKNKCAAKYILRKMSLSYKGKSKATRYTWDYNNSPAKLVAKK